MTRTALLRHLRRYGSTDSLWVNPSNGQVETVPRHAEIDAQLARKIWRQLVVPQPTEK